MIPVLLKIGRQSGDEINAYTWANTKLTDQFGRESIVYAQLK